jgi:hypothetical protein
VPLTDLHVQVVSGFCTNVTSSRVRLGNGMLTDVRGISEATGLCDWFRNYTEVKEISCSGGTGSVEF